jgi:glycosyltransferase involved in cell wall biosynthesis
VRYFGGRRRRDSGKVTDHYAEAAHRLARGEEENYHGQRYTVGQVSAIARSGFAVRVISVKDVAPLEHLPAGVETIGLKLYPGRYQCPRIRQLLRMAADWRPTHLMLQAPLTPMLNWATRNQVVTLPLLADSFRATGLRQRLAYRRLARALNHPAIRWVANHGANACADLVRIGVDGRKVLPFDWPPFDSPSKWPAKKAPVNPRTVQLVFAGQIDTKKGVGDLLEVIAIARSHGEDYRARLAGFGRELQALKRRARRLGVGDAVDFVGYVSRTEVLELMHAGDVVVVPSRHDYPEGMPQTIYQGLVSRTPVAVSNHPMFAGRVEHRRNGVVFRATDPKSFYQAIHDLVYDQSLYERLSLEGDAFAEKIHGPLKWHQVVRRWINGSVDDNIWLRQFAVVQETHAACRQAE